MNLYTDLGKTVLAGDVKSICENNRKSNEIMHCIDFFSWLVVLKIWAFLHDSSIYLLWVDITTVPPPPHQVEISEKCQNLQSYNSTKINAVHNLITFSIVFTNKNGGGGRLIPPP